MGQIKTSIFVEENVSSAFKAMNTTMNLVLNTFESMQMASGKAIDTSSIQAAREQLAKANVVASELQNQLSGLSIPKMGNDLSLNQVNLPNMNMPQMSNANESIINSIGNSSQIAANKVQEMNNRISATPQMSNANENIINSIGNSSNVASNAVQEMSNRISATPQMSNANENAIKAISNNSDQASKSIQMMNNNINSVSNSGFWTEAVGHYDKSVLEAVYTTEELVNMGFKSIEALKAQETAADSLNGKVDDLKENVQQWNSSSNIELFNSSGIERYQQEIQSANMMMDRLVQTQGQIQNRASNTNILPANAMSDLVNVNNRLETLKNKIQNVSNTKIKSNVASEINPQIEELREKLNNAMQAQETLNMAMENMDVTKANQAYLELESNVRDTEKYIRDNTDEQGKFNNAIKSGNTFASNLGNAIKSVTTAYLGIQGARKAISFVSDSMDLADIQNASEIQLKAVLKNVGATEKAYESLYAKAGEIQSRGIYGDEAMLGGAAEIATYIKDPKAIESMMDTLSNYAMGMSGGGEIDKKAMVDYATQLGKALDGTFDGLTKKGFTLTDVQKDIITNGTDMQKAMVLDDVISQSWDNLYNTMSNTPDSQIIRLSNAWGDIREKVGNAVYPAVMKFFSVISDNMPVIEKIVMGFANALYPIITILGTIISFVGSVASFIIDNWSIIGPIIMGIVVALGLYAGALTILNVVEGISNGLKAISAAHSALKAKASLAEAAATTTATGAQAGLNAALLACPITWILIGIILIIAAIYIVIAVINKVTGSSISATGVICGGINVVLQFFKNLGLGIADIALGIWNALGACISNIGTAFHNVIANIKGWFYGLLSTALKVVAGICEALNKLPFVEFDFSGIQNKAQEYANKSAEAYESKEEYKDVGSAFSEGMNTFDAFKEGWVSDAYNTGYNWGAGVENKIGNAIGNMFKKDELDLDEITGINSLKATNDMTNMADDIADTANNTGKVADTMDITEEDLQYLRDIAEQEVINRFTTAEIKVEMNNNNNISKDMDIDGIVSGLEDKIYEMANSMAEGVHN